MTFGLVKSIIEENLIVSYKDPESFKKSIKEFKHNILSDKKLSKIYSIYEDLYTPKGLSREDATEFLNESIVLIKSLVGSVKLPKNLLENRTKNKYQTVDSLVYTEPTSINILERVQQKKEIVSILMSEKNDSSKVVSIPVSSMVKIANQTLSNYIDGLDESDKKEFLEIIKEDVKSLESKYEMLKESAIDKLSPILESEIDSNSKSKLEETIKKIKEDKFNQINYLRLKSLVNSI